ncbi:MAG: hypothetical protein IJ529_03065 [Alphaproteobacteria bacterium]|nr:hypothetical protein [Alphaproteobacteria bacterium]
MTWFYFILICLGILTSSSIWAINLKLRRFERASKIIAMLGPWILFFMFIWSINAKGGNYSYIAIFFLSLLSTMMWIFAGCLLVGVIIILSVGTYWLTVTLKNTNYAVLRRKFRRDFAYGWERIRAWIEGEE